MNSLGLTALSVKLSRVCLCISLMLLNYLPHEVFAEAKVNKESNKEADKQPSKGAGKSVEMFDRDDVPINHENLWLPKSYRKHYPKLLKAAKTALALDRCVEVKEATLDLAQSTKEQPLYRVLCRQPNGLTYNEMVDGTTFNTLVMERREQGLVVACYEDIAAKTAMMQGLKWQSPRLPEPLERNDAYVVYRWDFDAVGIDDNLLHYKAVCRINRNRQVKTKISARRID